MKRHLQVGNVIMGTMFLGWFLFFHGLAAPPLWQVYLILGDFILVIQASMGLYITYAVTIALWTTHNLHGNRTPAIRLLFVVMTTIYAVIHLAAVCAILATDE
eukprot:1375605-Amorphochlora_amoeboformis.AAC.1